LGSGADQENREGDDGITPGSPAPFAAF